MNPKNISLTLFIALVCVSLMTPILNAKKKLKVGNPAPDFSLRDSQGTTRKLSEFLGKKNIVLCFVPYMNSSFSPHCKKQACMFNQSLKKFTENNTEIIFISYDDVKALAKFEKENHLGLILLSDHDKKVAQQYGAYSWYWPFPERRTIIIDKTGMIKTIMKNVDYANNVRDVSEALEIK